LLFTDFFTQVDSNRTRGNGFKLKVRRFRLDIRKKILHTEGGEALAQVTQRGCGVSSLEIFRSCLDVVLHTLLWVGPNGWRSPFPPLPF